MSKTIYSDYFDAKSGFLINGEPFVGGSSTIVNGATGEYYENILDNGNFEYFPSGETITMNSASQITIIPGYDTDYGQSTHFEVFKTGDIPPELVGIVDSSLYIRPKSTLGSNVRVGFDQRIRQEKSFLMIGGDCTYSFYASTNKTGFYSFPVRHFNDPQSRAETYMNNICIDSTGWKRYSMLVKAVPFNNSTDLNYRFSVGAVSHIRVTIIELAMSVAGLTNNTTGTWMYNQNYLGTSSQTNFFDDTNNWIMLAGLQLVTGTSPKPVKRDYSKVLNQINIVQSSGSSPQPASSLTFHVSRSGLMSNDGSSFNNGIPFTGMNHFLNLHNLRKNSQITFIFDSDDYTGRFLMFPVNSPEIYPNVVVSGMGTGNFGTNINILTFPSRDSCCVFKNANILLKNFNIFGTGFVSTYHDTRNPWIYVDGPKACAIFDQIFVTGLNGLHSREAATVYLYNYTISGNNSYAMAANPVSRMYIHRFTTCPNTVYNTRFLAVYNFSYIVITNLNLDWINAPLEQGLSPGFFGSGTCTNDFGRGDVQFGSYINFSNTIPIVGNSLHVANGSYVNDQ